MLPRRFREAVTREFQGERVLWVGRSSATRSALVASLIWLFAIPWTAFALGWEYMAIAGWLSGKPPPDNLQLVMGLVFPLFGLPFILIGLAMLAAPLFAWRWARRTVHVITDRRLASLTIGRSLKVKSHAIGSIVRTERREHRDGSGTLKVVTGIRRDSEGDKVEEVETFYGIADVRKVERLIATYLDSNRGLA